MPIRPRSLAVIASAILATLAMSLSTASATSRPTSPTSSSRHSGDGRHLSGNPSQAKAGANGAFDNCPSGVWCVFSGESGTDSCQNGSDSFPNLFQCDDLDQSLANHYSKIIRLYWYPSYQGSWICLPVGASVNDAWDIVFNNGSTDAGYGQTVADDVTSVQVGSGTCSNPAVKADPSR